MIPLLGPHDPFPPLRHALLEPNGLLAAGGTLDPERLVDAYARGIFPWFSPGDPVLWWSPDPRMVLFVDEFHPARSLRQRLRRGDYQVTTDRAFIDVLRGCAAPRPDQAGTWLVPQMMRAYRRLHEMGLAHSIESWADGELVGGLYGVMLGRMFFGESMFARRSDASKVAFAHLVAHLRAWECPAIDCQMSTPHLASLGAREIPRTTFVELITPLVGRSTPVWRFSPDITPV